MKANDVLSREGEVAAADGQVDIGSIDALKALWYEVRGLVHDQLTLATLEARRASNSLVTMIVMGVMLAVTAISAWLGLVVAAVFWLVSVGLTASIAMLFAVGINLVFAVILYQLIRRRSGDLNFPATLRSLRPVAPGVEGGDAPQ